MNNRLLVIATASLAVLIFAAGAFFFGNQSAPPAPPAEETTLYRAHAPIVGPVDAPVTITEFFDPSCEACRAFYPYVKDILNRYPQDVRLVLRYAAFHEGSDQAVGIIEAARLQDKFLPVLERLLGAQPEWAVHGAPNIERAWELAGETGLDLAKARIDAASQAVKAVLDQDAADVTANKVEFTPTFFVNGEPMGEPSPQTLQAMVDKHVTAARAGSAQ